MLMSKCEEQGNKEHRRTNNDIIHNTQNAM
jgi:hypothetical protein